MGLLPDGEILVTAEEGSKARLGIMEEQAFVGGYWPAV